MAVLGTARVRVLATRGMESALPADSVRVSSGKLDLERASRQYDQCAPSRTNAGRGPGRTRPDAGPAARRDVSSHAPQRSLAPRRQRVEVDGIVHADAPACACRCKSSLRDRTPKAATGRPLFPAFNGRPAQAGPYARPAPAPRRIPKRTIRLTPAIGELLPLKDGPSRDRTRAKVHGRTARCDPHCIGRESSMAIAGDLHHDSRD